MGYMDQDVPVWKRPLNLITHSLTFYKDVGDIDDENNYRPIFVIGHIAKMVEALVSYQVSIFLRIRFYFNWSICLFEKALKRQTSLHHDI